MYPALQMSKKALVDLCQQETSKFLMQGSYELAVPGAIQVSQLLFVQYVCGIHVYTSSQVLPGSAVLLFWTCVR